MSSDILIIGGGIIGLSIARELHKRGHRKICVVDKGVAGREASWAAAGMLGPQAETDEFGPFFQMCCESRALYPDFASELLDETAIDIELERSGTLALAITDDDGTQLLSRYRRQCEAGLEVELLSTEEVIKLEPFVSAAVQFGLFFANDWQVENRLLVNALRRYAELNSIEIREHTPVDSLLIDDGRVTGVETPTGRIIANQTVVATGAWTTLIKLGRVAMPFVVEPVRGQIVCLHNDPGQFRHVIHTPRGYIVPRLDGRILAGSTSEKVGFVNEVTVHALEGIRNMAAEISPFLKGPVPEEVWSGLRPFAADGYPVLGSLRGVDSVFVATAHYRNGILLAPLTAKIAAANISEGIETEYLRTFSAERLLVHTAATGGEI